MQDTYSCFVLFCFVRQVARKHLACRWNVFLSIPDGGPCHTFHIQSSDYISSPVKINSPGFLRIRQAYWEDDKSYFIVRRVFRKEILIIIGFLHTHTRHIGLVISIFSQFLCLSLFSLSSSSSFFHRRSQISPEQEYITQMSARDFLPPLYTT